MKAKQAASAKAGGAGGGGAGYVHRKLKEDIPVFDIILVRGMYMYIENLKGRLLF